MRRFLCDFFRNFFVFSPKTGEGMLFLASGMLGGFLCGFFGTGGGMVIVLTALLFSKRDGAEIYAVTTAAVALFTLGALAVHLFRQVPQWSDVPLYFLPGLLGGAAGAMLLPHVPRGVLRVLFSLMLLAGGALMLYRGIFHA